MSRGGGQGRNRQPCRGCDGAMARACRRLKGTRVHACTRESELPQVQQTLTRICRAGEEGLSFWPLAVLCVSRVSGEEVKSYCVLVCTFACPVCRDPREVTFCYAQDHKDVLLIFISDTRVYISRAVTEL